jgi:hypothetical protein
MSDHEDLEFARRIAEPLREPVRVDPVFAVRIASAVRAAADRRDVPWARVHDSRRAFGWLIAPRRFAVSPLAGMAFAAGFAALVAATTLALNGERGVIASMPPVTTGSGPEVVQFAIVAPNATSVALVGDFNAWDTTTTPMTKGAVEGLWMVTLPLATGSYQYAFVVDGTTWVADPAAPLAVEDEFGTPSSLLTIRGGRT